jgi:hypothetical protein
MSCPGCDVRSPNHDVVRDLGIVIWFILSGLVALKLTCKIVSSCDQEIKFLDFQDILIVEPFPGKLKKVCGRSVSMT